MLHLKPDHEEDCSDAAPDDSRTGTPAMYEYAPSTSMASVELRTSFSIAQERLLVASLTELENRISSISYGTRLPKPKGIELAPYRPQGIGVQSTIFKSLVSEWSLFHNMPVVGKQVLEIQETPPPLPKQGVFPLSPVLCHRQQGSADPLWVSGKQLEPAGGNTCEEGAHGGLFDNTTADEDVFSLPTCEEVIAIDNSLPLPDILSDYATDYDIMVLSEGRDPITTPNHSKEALVHDVVAHTISEVWASCVIPVLESLIPDQGVALVDQHVRSSTTNSVTTESSGKNTSTCLHGKRPHTGEPRSLTTQSQSIIWVPENELDTPPGNPCGTSQDDLNDDEVCVYRTPPLPNGDEFNLNMNIAGGRLGHEHISNSRRKDKNRRKAEKRRQRKRQKELQQQQNRITEYVAEQTAIGDTRRDRLTPEISLPPLYDSTDVRCGSTGSSYRRESSSRDNQRRPPNPPSPVVDQNTDRTQDLEVTQSGLSSGYAREPLRLPTLLCNKQATLPRYEWPTRAQTAIPSHARPLRLQQQFPP
eukprot:TRINITY_DN5899_c0_g1_i1.p1 TRINITY_DN5899_c0_g1~~TRINITY_DN5899_c0_g1_i1.p1  ORF type:complete len:532 (+),score=82.96 TRINITY_DN5899_c0_g1_i1:255-1850(+)